MKEKMENKRNVLIDPLYEPIDMPADFLLLYRELLSTLEMRRASWLMQSGLLFEAYPGCTHTRRAHAIGCWIVGYNSLRDVKVKTPTSGGEISLEEWLEGKGVTEDYNYRKKDIKKEYLTALLLHDIGHPPFSHVMEMNPFIEIDHEEVTRSLIYGEPVGGKNWYFQLTESLSIYRTLMKDISSLEEWDAGYKEQREKVKTCFKVLENGKMETSSKIVGEILEGKAIDKRITALHQLVDSQVDMDRIDHFLRDSYYSGVKFAEYKMGSLLQNLVVVTEGTPEYERIVQLKQTSILPFSYLLIRPEGIEYVEHLLTTREFIFRKVLWDPKNLFFIGVLNLAIHALFRREPFLYFIIPFMTDQLLLHLLKERKFAKLTINGYNRILSLDIPYEEFEQVTLKFKESVNSMAKVREVYERVQKYNLQFLSEPKVIFFMFWRKRKEEDQGWKKVIDGRNYKSLEDSEQELFNWLEEGKRKREETVYVWVRNVKLDNMLQQTGLAEFLEVQKGNE